MSKTGLVVQVTVPCSISNFKIPENKTESSNDQYKSVTYYFVDIENVIILVMCPPGFTSTDGLTDCKPCERNSFWINATRCENCPDGFGTRENGVPDIDGCKG